MGRFAKLRGVGNRRPTDAELAEMKMSAAEYAKARKAAMDAQPYRGSERESDDRHGRNLPLRWENSPGPGHVELSRYWTAKS